MPVEINYIDTFQTRVYQSFVNLTAQDSPLYLATTSIRISRPENCTNCELLISISIFDQWAVRVKTAS